MNSPLDCQRVEFVMALVRFYGVSRADAEAHWKKWVDTKKRDR